MAVVELDAAEHHAGDGDASASTEKLAPVVMEEEEQGRAMGGESPTLSRPSVYDGNSGNRNLHR
jgi:hypothetical protein